MTLWSLLLVFYMKIEMGKECEMFCNELGYNSFRYDVGDCLCLDVKNNINETLIKNLESNLLNESG